MNSQVKNDHEKQPDETTFEARLSRKEASNYRGKPDKEALIELARTYLETQAKLWPALVTKGNIPQASQGILEKMAEEFERLYMGKEDLAKYESELSGTISLGIAYARYSSDNSNPRSLDQQLKLILECAVKHQVFIPWRYVFADAGVTGRTSKRRGYQMAKMMVKNTTQRINFLIIDEIARASRDAIETLQLGQLIDKYSIRLLGASDGFDSSQPQSKMQLHLSAIIHEQFIDNLKSKVNRGRRDAFEKGQHVVTPAVGYRLETLFDDLGNPLLKHSGKIWRKQVIDEDQAGHIRKAFELYVNQGWSPSKISELFNKLLVGKKNNWQPRKIRDLFRRTIYKGLHTDGMTTEIINQETGARERLAKPKQVWKTKELPHLRIVSEDLWQQANEKMDLAAEMYKKDRGPKPIRTGLYPDTLFRPICGSCKLKMWRGRSGKHACFTCTSNSKTNYNCEYQGHHKSVRILDTAILDYLFNQLFTDAFLDRVVSEANKELERQKNEPSIDVESLLREMNNKKRRSEAITKKLAEQTDDKNMQSIFDLVKSLNCEIVDLKKQIDFEVAKSGIEILPINKEELIKMLEDLRGLLTDDIPAASKVLEELTGPIKIEIRESKKGEKVEWYAHFVLQGAKAIALLARKKKYPTTGSWVHLTSCRWILGDKVTVPIVDMPKHLFLLEELQKEWQETKSISSVAARFNIYASDVKTALELKQRPKLPIHYVPAYVSEVKRSGSQYLTLGQEVVRLKDERFMTIPRIAEKLDISLKTVQRAYDRAKKDPQENNRKNNPLRPVRGSTNLPYEIFEKIDELAKQGKKFKEIAKVVGCSENTAYMRMRKLKELGMIV